MNDSSQARLFSDVHTARSVLCRSGEAKDPSEWQADFFSSCLLMPKAMVLKAWRDRFGSLSPVIFENVKDRGAWRRPGRSGLVHIRTIFRDAWEPDESYLFDRVAREFTPLFRVSVQAMRIKLESLGLLLKDRPKDLFSGSVAP